MHVRHRILQRALSGGLQLRTNLAFLTFSLLPLLLSGCFAPATPTKENRPDPSSFATPVWNPGEKWNYKTNTGLWQNQTVIDRELWHGWDAYRVQVNWSHADHLGLNQYTEWLDPASLGLVGERQGSITETNSSPLTKIFPLANKTYAVTSRVDVAGSPTSGSANITVSLGQWQTMQGPAGEFQVLEVTSRASGNLVDHGWFSPSLGNYVQFDMDGTNFNAKRMEFMLQSWSSPSG